MIQDDGLLSERRSDFVHRLDHGLVHGAIRHIFHKPSVNLHVIDRQVLGTGEGSHARIKVIQGGATTHGAQVRNKYFGSGHSGNSHGFCSLTRSMTKDRGRLR
jgi:hypothetical protein